MQVEQLFLRQAMFEPSAAFSELPDTHLGLYAPYGQSLQRLVEKLADGGLQNLTPALLWAEVAPAEKDKLTELGLGLELLESLYGQGGITPEEGRYALKRLREERARRVLTELLDDCRSQVVLDEPLAVLNKMFSRMEEAQRILTTGEKEYLRGEEISDFALGMLADFYNTGGGWATGMFPLDNLLGGFRPGQLIVVGAWTSHGKSLFAQALADGITGANKDAGDAYFLDCEMGVPTTVGRVAQRIAGYRITSPKTLEEAVQRINPHLARIAGSRTVVGAPRSMTLQHAVQRSQSAVALGCRVIIWDGGNILRIPGKENRQQEIEEITRTAKRFALEHDVIVILTGQLLQTPAAQNGSLPRLPEVEDFKGSRTFSEDADYAFLIRRVDYKPCIGDVERYEMGTAADLKKQRGLTWVGIGKDRHSGKKGEEFALRLNDTSLRYEEEADYLEF